jgi:hypothetical protein
MSRFLAICLLASPLLAGELDALLGKLRDPASREDARRSLVERGTPALGDLRAALDGATDEGFKACLEGVVKEIEAREPHGLRFEVLLPKTRLTLADVNRDDFKLSIEILNRGTETVVLWPYLSLRLLDAKGQEVKPKLHIGRWGRGRPKTWLEDVKYGTLAPGGKWGFETPLSRYVRDDTWIGGWEVSEPGTYTIEATYRFDRAAAKKTCDPAWQALDDPGKPWNRALEMTHVFTAEMTVAGR